MFKFIYKSMQVYNISVPKNRSYNNPSFGIKFTPKEFSDASANLVNIMKSDYDNPYNFIFSREFTITNAIRATKNYGQFVTEQVNAGKDIHIWDNADFKLVEGLQYGLKSFENMTMKAVFKLIELLSTRKNITLPVVRGCFHNCAHCFLGANAHVERMSYENFINFFKDLETMSSRLKKKVNKFEKDTELFYDSDGSQVYLTDKSGKEHEFPELAHTMYKYLRAKSLFDTAGWNPKSEKTQKRMENLVKYYVENPDRYEKDINAINLSINPFESTYFTAIKQKRAGNIENYEKLKDYYIDMVVNMLHTFAPLFKHDNLSIICRVFPDHFEAKELDGFRVDDMIKLRNNITARYKKKYSEDFKNNLELLYLIKEKFNITDDIGTTARDNFLKNYSNDGFEKQNLKTLTDSEIKDIKFYNQNILLDMDGSIYLGNDYRLYKTDLQLQMENPKKKKLELPIYSKIIDFAG